MKKRYLIFSLCLLLLTSILMTSLPSGMVLAQDDEIKGSGNEYDPYIVETAEQLKALRTRFLGMDGYVRLEADIVLNDETFTFDPDTGLVTVTDGTHTAYLGTGIAGDNSGENNLFDQTPSKAGVFYLSQNSLETGEYPGELYNWHGFYTDDYESITFDGNGHTIYGFYSSDSEYAGLIGRASATVKNLSIQNAYVYADSYAGVFAGYLSGNIMNCRSTAIVCGGSVIGGLAGYSGSILQSESHGIVNGQSKVGGIAGSCSSLLRYCRNYASVSGQEHVGGLAGSATYVEQSFNHGNVHGTQNVGGIVGNANALIQCLNTGIVQGNAFVGALAGEECLYAESNYYFSDAVGAHLYAFGTTPDDSGLNASEMTKKSSYTGFDFTYTFFMEDGDKMPYFIWEADVQKGEQSALWDGSVSESLTGSGTEENPFLIQSAADLAYLSNAVKDGNEFKGQYLRLTADIRFNDTTKQYWILNAVQFRPIGGTSREDGNPMRFSGTFEGDGHTISGLYIDTPTERLAGLFGFINWGKVTNLKIMDSFIRGYSGVGSILGNDNGATITNCYSDATVIGVSGVGGIAGNANTIKDCENHGAVHGSSTVGGVCGYGTVENCINGENATVIGASSVGGVAGGGSFTNCQNYGTVIGYREDVGGIGGSAYGTTNCVNKGTVYGNEIVGGISGSNFGAVGCVNEGDVYGKIAVGGIGGILNGYISICANNGSISAEHAVGGIIGCVKRLSIHIPSTSSIMLCRNSGSVTGISSVGGIAGDMVGHIEANYNEGEILGEVIVGGIAGTSADTIQKSFTVGKVSGSYSIGAIVGNGSAEYNNYYLIGTLKTSSTIGLNNNDSSQALTAEQMADKERLYGFNFETEYCMPEGAPYPCFLWEIESSIANAVWDGSIAESFAGGNGSTEDPYVIKTPAQLARLSAYTEEYKDCHFVLANDIRFNQTDAEDWVKDAIDFTPIQTFGGTFDGKGYAIIGLYISKTESNVALFAKNYGTIQNLILKDSVIIGGTYVAGIAAENNGTVSHCINEATVNGNQTVGGIVGHGTGTAYDCINRGRITAYINYVGGIAGYSNCIRCTNEGNVRGTEYVGGIAGASRNAVTHCVNEGSVYGETAAVGGVIGCINGATVSHCINQGYVTATVTAGGIAGDHYKGALRSCLSVHVPFATYAGGIIGDYKSAISGFEIQYCYYIQYVASQAGTGGGTVSFKDKIIPVDSEKARDPSQYTYLSFSRDWVMGSKHPILAPEHEHIFDQQNTDDTYLVQTGGSCTVGSTFLYSCSCGEKGTETFTAITASDKNVHNPAGDILSETDGHYQLCADCGEKVKVGEHNFKEKALKEDYLIKAATCHTEAFYYYSCECGKKGITVFQGGERLEHDFSMLCSDNDGHYYACQLCEDVWKSTTPSPHTFDEGVIHLAPTVDCEGQGKFTCTECGYEKYVTLDKLPEESISTDPIPSENEPVQAKTDANTLYIIFGVLAGCALLIAATLIILYKKGIQKG